MIYTPNTVVPLCNEMYAFLLEQKQIHFLYFLGGTATANLYSLLRLR